MNYNLNKDMVILGGSCQADSIKLYFLEKLAEQTDTLLDAIGALVPDSEEDIAMDAEYVVSSLPGYVNLDGNKYYQIKARTVGGITEFVICDRDGNVAAQKATQYGCAVIEMYLMGDIASDYITNKGYNKQNQLCYDNAFNLLQHSWYNSFQSRTNYLNIFSLEIKTVAPSEDYIILGEFYYGGNLTSASSTVFSIKIPISNS
jgi:hypothetical protein